VPRLQKIVVNMGISASLEKSAIDDAAKDLALITGRKAVVSSRATASLILNSAKASPSAAASRCAAMPCMNFLID